MTTVRKYPEQALLQPAKFLQDQTSLKVASLKVTEILEAEGSRKALDHRRRKYP